MKTICEIVAQDILPILRAAVAKELISSYNLNQSEAAKLLDVSQPAVSQYLRQLRGKSNLIENKTVITEIKDISNKLYLKQIDQSQLAANMCRISKIILDDGKNGSFHKIDDCAACR